MSVSPRRFLSFEEYLALEETSAVRHEYVSGATYAMTGGSISHNRIAVSLALIMGPGARAAGCDLFISDARLAVDDSLVYYPDVMVCCDPDDTDDRFRRWPCLVAEVLSPGTRSVDRREKLRTYLGIPTVLTCLLVDPASLCVEAHTRTVPGAASWTHEVLDLDGELELTCPPVTVRVRDVFAP